MTDITKIPGVSEAEVTSLWKQGIKNTDDFWLKVGQDYDANLQVLANTTGISKDRLADILAESLVYQQASGETNWLKRHRVQVLGLVLLLVLGGLVARALGAFEGIPPPLGLQQTVVVATHDLSKGATITKNDITISRLTFQEGYFTSTLDLDYLVLAADVPRGRPVRARDVLQPQVVAAANIVSGNIIASEMVTVTWSSYITPTYSSVDMVVGRPAKRDIMRGQAIVADFVGGRSPTAMQVVAQREIGALQMLTATDLGVSDTPLVRDALTEVNSAVGKLLLQPLLPGGTLRQTHLLDPAELNGRTVLVVPVSPAAARLPVYPSRVALLLTPRESITNVGSGEIPDVLVLRSEQTDELTYLTVAVPEAEVAKIERLLGVSDVYVLRAFPSPAPSP